MRTGDHRAHASSLSDGPLFGDPRARQHVSRVAAHTAYAHHHHGALVSSERACKRRYGALNAGNVCVGLLFYREHSYMTGTQLALALTGTAIILVGIGVGRLPPKRRDACRQSVKV